MIGIVSDGHGRPHFMLGGGLAVEGGVAVSTGAGPGTVNTGFNGELNCSAIFINGSLSSNGSQSSVQGGVNIIGAEIGCSAGGSYTW